MTDTELLNKIIEIVFDADSDWKSTWNDTVNEIYGCVRDTEYYNQLVEKKKVYEQKRKIKELKNRQKRAEEEVKRLMIELQQLEAN